METTYNFTADYPLLLALLRQGKTIIGIVNGCLEELFYDIETKTFIFGCEYFWQDEVFFKFCLNFGVKFLKP